MRVVTRDAHWCMSTADDRSTEQTPTDGVKSQGFATLRRATAVVCKGHRARHNVSITDLMQAPDNAGRFLVALDECKKSCTVACAKANMKAVNILPVSEPLQATLKSGVFDDMGSSMLQAIKRLADAHHEVMRITARWQDHRLKAIKLDAEMLHQEIKGQVKLACALNCDGLLQICPTYL